MSQPRRLLCRANRCFWRFAEGVKTIDSVIMAFATVLLTLATIALALIAYFQWRALNHTDETITQTMISANRAWIAPGGISVLGKIDGDKLNIQVFSLLSG